MKIFQKEMETALSSAYGKTEAAISSTQSEVEVAFNQQRKYLLSYVDHRASVTA
jgi:hypothetical protein